MVLGRLGGERLSFSEDGHHSIHPTVTFVDGEEKRYLWEELRREGFHQLWSRTELQKWHVVVLLGRALQTYQTLVSYCVGREAPQAAAMDVCFFISRVFCLMLAAKVSRWLFLLGVEFIPGETNIDPKKRRVAKYLRAHCQCHLL